MEKRIFIGNAKRINDFLIGGSICVTDIPKEWIKEYKNGKKYLNINIYQRKEKDKFGNDYSISINTFVPDKKLKEETNDCPF